MHVAILIDAENVLPAHADLIFQHAASLGDVVSKEIYGAASALSAWVAPVLKYAIHPNLTIKAAKGKNSSDIALVIGAMDLLVGGSVDAAIIASSDSDFSALSVRLRNAGIEVIGMGTEKANELWRTACSSFVVLQTAKPAQAAAKQQPAARQQSAPAQQPKQQAAPAQPKRQSRAERAQAATHEERVAVIRTLIEKRLKGHNGRMQVSTLFPALNQLAEYRVDKSEVGKKPMNYLTSVFGDVFTFEEAADGQSWVSLPGVAPVAEEAPAEMAQEVPAEDEAPAADEAPVAKEAPEAETAAPVAEEPAELPVEETPAAAGPEMAEAEAAEPEAEEAPDPLALLMDAGLPEDVAGQIVVIFTESESLRAAYNRLRKEFGATAGRAYYQKVKEIAGRR